MAFSNAGLICTLNSADVSYWHLKTVDAVGTVVGAGYVTGAGTSLAGKGVAGRGMKLGDPVFVQVVDSVSAPTSVSDCGWYYVSAISSSTGAATLVAVGAT